MNSDTRFEAALERGAAGAKDSKGNRAMWIAIGVLVAGLALVAVALVSGRVRETELQKSVDVLAGQVRGLGGTPSLPPGIPGPEGVAGAPGRDGVDGRDGKDGVTPPCLSESPQCRGADGADGRDGVDATGVQGEPGAPGQDATGVPGLTGPTGPTGPTGEKGDPGQPGAPPAGWTWIDSDGRRQSCARDVGSPDTAPTYTCTAPSPEPTQIRNPVVR